MSSNLARSKLFSWSAVSKYCGKSVLDFAYILRSFIIHMDLGVSYMFEGGIYRIKKVDNSCRTRDY